MAKLLKILAYTVGSVFEWVLIMVIVLAFAIRTPPVQTYFAGKATDYLSRELGAEVKVDKVAIVFIDKVALDGVLIRDQSGDTLLYARRIIVSLHELNLKEKKFTIGDADIDEAFVHIQRSKDNVFNHAFIKDYFTRDKKKKSKIKFKLKYATLTNSRFQYDDHRKERLETGVDYFHLNTAHINAQISDFKIKKDIIFANVDKISLEEKCGFKLNQLNTHAEISPRGVLLSNLEIKTDDSYVKSTKLNMISKNYSCFKYFVDSVSFDGKIDESDVSLKDVAYFAYVLEGMDDQVQLKTEVKNKVTDLQLKNFDLKYENHSRIKGTINLDDYRTFEQGFFHEKLNYVYLDLKELKKLKLPKSSPERYISISPEIERLRYIEAKSITLVGMYTEFVVAAKEVKTHLGGAQLDHGIMFIANEQNGTYNFERSESSNYDIKVNNFNLGAYLNDKNIGVIDGKLFLSGEIFSASRIDFTNISGKVGRFDYLDYPYSNIEINEGSFKQDIFEGDITIHDKNIDLTYNGFIDLTGDQHMKFSIDLRRALLDELNLSSKDTELRTSCDIDIRGKNLDNYQGTINLEGFKYKSEVPAPESVAVLRKKSKVLDIEKFNLLINRSKKTDHFEIKSSAGNAKIDGKIDFEHLVSDFNQQLSRVFPSLYNDDLQTKKKQSEDNFKFDITVFAINDFLEIFYPELHIADNTTAAGNFNSKTSDLSLKLESDYLKYKDISFKKLLLNQEMLSNSITALYKADQFNYTSEDTIQFNNVYFKTSGGNDQLSHILTWEQENTGSSNIVWSTDIYGLDNYRMVVDPSHFFIKDLQWDIAHESSLRIHSDTIRVNDFELTRGDQEISIYGYISKQDEDKLNFKVKNLKLGEFSSFITNEYPMTGLIDSEGYLSNPFYNLDFNSTSSLTNFQVKDRRVGDIQLKADWDKEKQSVSTSGNLTYIDEKTFDFKGDYFLYKDEDNLDFDLNFDYTDIQFTNAFMDPDVVSEIRGFLHGNIDLTGTTSKPMLDGKVSLAAGSAFMDMLGVHVGIDGPIEIDEYGFYINGIPVFDEDGNSGILVGAVFHENFEDFNFDLQFDLEMERGTDGTYASDNENRFLVMNLPYSQDGLYYGKGYVTGMANVFGYTDNLEITVDFKTERGTEVNIPMYGVGELEEENFITFVSYGDLIDTIIETPKYDLSGVVIDLNFEVTKDAEINIIFNEELGDVINARGSGDIAISLDDVGDVKMEGVYTVDNGEYNFALDPTNTKIAFKQKFIIEPGGSISWKGDPYDADLNLRTYYKLNTNLAAISNDQLGGGKGAHQTVLSYLDLTGSMSSPTIGFDIQAPDADEIGQTLINRIKSDPDELNRQFFLLMLTRRFQPIDARLSGGNGSAALDLLANQINSMLSAVSSEYNLNVDFNSDQITGDNKLEFGLSKGFLDDRLILSGSFGVENYGENSGVEDENGEVIGSELIGDVRLEYLLNESGTFRVNIFNESTDRTIIQDGDQGKFTQGAGLNYREDFNSIEDFKLIQYVLDIFRKKGNKRYLDRGKKQQRRVPPETEIKEEPELKPETEE